MNRKFNETLMSLKPSKSGKSLYRRITPEIYDQLQKIEVGGMVYFKEVKSKDGTQTYYFLEYADKESTEAFFASLPPLDPPKPQADEF